MTEDTSLLADYTREEWKIKKYSIQMFFVFHSYKVYHKFIIKAQ